MEERMIWTKLFLFSSPIQKNPASPTLLLLSQCCFFSPYSLRLISPWVTVVVLAVPAFPLVGHPP